NCAGDGRVRSVRDLKVNIPAGIADGMRIRMTGEGEVGPGGGPSGDLYIEISTEDHPYFIREGDDLHVNVKVPAVEAMLGAQVEVALLDDSVATIDIEPGTQPDSVIRLRDKGIPHMRRDGKGSLVAHVDVTIPKDLSRAEREAAEKLREHSKEHAEVTTKQDSTGGLFSRLRSKFSR
ncbi:DnaJ C-terminal domain-containing protein, partial [Corynebacterium falsenii]